MLPTWTLEQSFKLRDALADLGDPVALELDRNDRQVPHGDFRHKHKLEFCFARNYNSPQYNTLTFSTLYTNDIVQGERVTAYVTCSRDGSGHASVPLLEGGPGSALAVPDTLEDWAAVLRVAAKCAERQYFEQLDERQRDDPGGA